MLLQHISLKEKILLACQSILLLALFLYSFTQIDLGLTFSKNLFFRQIIMSFQHIGYFERSFSAQFYVTLILLLTLFYIVVLRFAYLKKVSKKFVWIGIWLSIVFLVFSYNAFSYDIFNYIFDAKILTHYHANPYLHKALDYPTDPMLSFMHWTHRTYPYGPFWLVATVPLSLLGLQFFLPTFYLFKFVIAASFLGTVWSIGKISQKLFPKREVFTLAFFAFNPLVLIECLVSAHIDGVMMFFAVYAFFLLINQQQIKSFFSLIISVGIKFLTAVLVPIFLYISVLQNKKKKILWETQFVLILVLLLLGMIIESHQSGNFQPWYLLAPLSFIVFLKPRYYVIIPTVVLSAFALILYVPYLSIGNWDPPVPQMLQEIIIMGYSISFCLTSFYFLYRQWKRFRTRKTQK